MRLLDADALGVGRCSVNLLPADYCAGWNGLINLIEQAPTVDAVPVVRCRECKFRKPTFSGEDYFCTVWDADDSETAYVTDNDFCSYGEQKGGAD